MEITLFKFKARDLDDLPDREGHIKIWLWLKPYNSYFPSLFPEHIPVGRFFPKVFRFVLNIVNEPIKTIRLLKTGDEIVIDSDGSLVKKLISSATRDEVLYSQSLSEAGVKKGEILALDPWDPLDDGYISTSQVAQPLNKATIESHGGMDSNFCIVGEIES